MRILSRMAIDVLFSTGAGFSSGELLSSLKRQTPLGGLPQKEPQTPSFTLQEESTWTQMPTTQKKIQQKPGELILIGK